MPSGPHTVEKVFGLLGNPTTVGKTLVVEHQTSSSQEKSHNKIESFLSEFSHAFPRWRCWSGVLFHDSPQWPKSAGMLPIVSQGSSLCLSSRLPIVTGARICEAAKKSRKEFRYKINDLTVHSHLLLEMVSAGMNLDTSLNYIHFVNTTLTTKCRWTIIKEARNYKIRWRN